MVQVEPKTPTRPPVPLPSTEQRLVKMGEVAAPSARMLQKALEAIIQSKACADVGLANDVKPGDVFLLYDLSLRLHGQEPYRVCDQIPMHGILTQDGLPDAPAVFEQALAQLIRPIKSYATGLINDTKREMGTLEDREPKSRTAFHRIS